MQRQPVESSNLRSVRYDPTTRVLEIEFQTGRVYQYSDVPESAYANLMAADSKGSYFNACIKGVFWYARV